MKCGVAGLHPPEVGHCSPGQSKRWAERERGWAQGLPPSPPLVQAFFFFLVHCMACGIEPVPPAVEA